MHFREYDIEAALPPYVDLSTLDAIIERALREDIGTGDITTEATVDPDTSAGGSFVLREAGTIAGLAVASRIFQRVDTGIVVDWCVRDGIEVPAGETIGVISGPASGILQAERLALNILQRMSGIASATQSLVRAAAGRSKILDTRKTVPGLRVLDKWAVLLGGGMNHRMGLFDMILIKDNHIAAAGSVDAVVSSARAWRKSTGRTEIIIEIEARTMAEIDAILSTSGVDRILLDNMVTIRSDGSVDTSRLRDAVHRIGRRVETEASGNVNLFSVPDIAQTGVDYISSGALTHSVKVLDISLMLSINQTGESTR